MTRRILFTAALILALGQTCSVSSAETSAETLHSVYITSQGNHMLTVIDNRSDQVVGKVDLGLIPTQIEVSSALPRLIAMDGVARQLQHVFIDVRGDDLYVPIRGIGKHGMVVDKRR